MSSKSRQDLEAWLKTIDVSGRVLDVGSAQLPIKGRTKSWKVKDYKTIDLENPHENKVIPDWIGDIQQENLSPKDKVFGYFNIVFCIEVSEYWTQPHKALWNIGNYLKKEGILYISVHTLYGLHKPENLDYLRYTRYGIEKLLKETGFEIKEIIPRKITEAGILALQKFYAAEGMKILYNENTFNEGYLIKAVKV